MDVMLFLKSALIGLSIAAPVGPIGLLCIQRSLAHGMRIGLISGLGAAAADACYGTLGALGIGAITRLFVDLATPLALGGAVFLGWMGWKMLRTSPPERAANAVDPARALSAFASVFVLTLSNPLTILSFIAVFATLAGGAPLSTASAALMVVGVFLGSAAWWLVLALSVAMLRHRLDARTMRWIDRVAGGCLLAFAVWQFLRTVIA